MRKLLVIAALFSLAGCSSGGKQEKTADAAGKGDLPGAIRELKAFEDSLNSKSPSGVMEYDPQTAVTYAEKCLSIYHRFPKSEEAPKYMDKAHVIFASANLHQRSVVVADSLILLYPMYKNRPMVLESLAGAYDVFVIPRQKEKVKYYYELLLKENPNMDAEKRKQIENRLKYVDLTFEEYISKAN